MSGRVFPSSAAQAFPATAQSRAPFGVAGPAFGGHGEAPWVELGDRLGDWQPGGSSWAKRRCRPRPRLSAAGAAVGICGSEGWPSRRRWSRGPIPDSSRALAPEESVAAVGPRREEAELRLGGAFRPAPRHNWAGGSPLGLGRRGLSPGGPPNRDRPRGAGPDGAEAVSMVASPWLG
ncbi:hypothetical protein NDU88_000514 [Pleurodeles waltl]|uniref:Uncharacterized protein n=1 Tax=Pleurodeles waltl TaxID=8319 RepID=A0AAV7S7Q2_PLEWA|nr:hypothetical protein NDU88_000514 [Pleurodeles waltl]